MVVDGYEKARKRNGVTNVTVMRTVWTPSGPATRCKVTLEDGHELVRDYAGEAYSQLILNGVI